MAAGLAARAAAGGGVCLALRYRGRSVSTTAHLYYQSAHVPRSLTSSGLVGTYRDLAGSDSEFFGVEPLPTLVHIQDGREAAEIFSLDTHGFELIDDSREGRAHIDYYSATQVLHSYYSECERLVSGHTGASRVIAFDHNVRARARKALSERMAWGSTCRAATSTDEGFAVQEPLITYGVHNDYTLMSSVRRIRQLAAPATKNDTLRAHLGGRPNLMPENIDRLLKGRWAFVNVWRNISTTPVIRSPLGLVDARSVAPEDLIVFEIRYADRVGENYFATHQPQHAWWYFPNLTRDECLLIKCWDSRGKDFVGRMETMHGWEQPDAASIVVPATFSLHSGFEDPLARADAPERESIEVRTVAFFD